MVKWLERLLGRVPEGEAGAPGERALDLEREVQHLRIELAEERERAARLRQVLERQRGDAEMHVSGRVEAQVEHLLTAAAAPVAQLLTQTHLVEEGQPVAARDVLTVARRLVRVLEDIGLTVEGEIGERAPFDPDRQEPLSAAVLPQRGQPVVVRFVGVVYRGQVLRKAGVEPALGEPGDD
ncbi:MAG TPA: hypothetical protein ENN99_16625 [Chloroflexi bacterium]|nr:hypothetical protein [Chloroflexota bacterium]